MDSKLTSDFEDLSRQDEWPFSPGLLSLAFRHFESSFETESAEQALLSLMISLEIMLSPNARGSI